MSRDSEQAFIAFEVFGVEIFVCSRCRLRVVRVLVAQCGVVRLHQVDEALLDLVELASLLNDVADLHPLLFLQRDDDRALVGGMIREEVYPKCKPINFGDLRDQMVLRPRKLDGVVSCERPVIFIWRKFSNENSGYAESSFSETVSRSPSG